RDIFLSPVLKTVTLSDQSVNKDNEVYVGSFSGSGASLMMLHRVRRRAHLLERLQRQANLEPGLAKLRFEAHIAMMAAHNPVDYVETQTTAVAYLFGGEEWVEDPVADFRRDAGAAIDDLDQRAVRLFRGADAQFALTFHGIDGVVDEIRPDLVKLA